MTAILPPVSQSFRAPPATPNDFVYRLTVDEYHEMIRQGILNSDPAIELLEGWLIAKMTKHPPHTVSTQLTREALESLLPAGWFLNVQEPVTTIDSEPEPDVTAIKGKRRDYVNAHPAPKDVGLLVEIADTSLDRDQFAGQEHEQAGQAAFGVDDKTDDGGGGGPQPTLFAGLFPAGFIDVLYGRQLL